MKLVGSVTFTASATAEKPAADKQVTSTKDIGEVDAAEARTAVFMFASSLANDIPSGAVPRALSVTVEQ